GEKIRGGTPSVCIPCGSALAATWDLDLIGEIAHLLADQVKSKGAHILLAPTVNIHRAPLAGRNFECYSEDPYLTTRMAVAYINSLQEDGVGACIKHFIANDQEFQRNSISSEVDERTLHEIYLPPFLAAVQEANVWSVMSSYNRMNGVYCSEDKALLIDLLKDKWGFDGMVISDWFGSYSDNAAAGGLDLEMPGTARWMGDNVLKMVQDSSLDVSIIDDKIRRLLRTLERVGAKGEIQPETIRDRPEDRALVRRAGADSIVLLKNEGGLLPLNNEQTIAVIGANARWTQFHGGGSATVMPPYSVSPLAGIQQNDVEIQYAIGCTIHKRLPSIDSATLTLEYRNDPDGEIVHTATTKSSEIAWFGDLPDGVEDTFALRMHGSFVPSESGLYQFSLAGVGEINLSIGDKATLSNTVNSADVGSPFEMWDQEKTVSVELTGGEAVEISADYLSPADVPFRALRIGHLPPMAEDTIAEAVAAAAEADVAVIVAGLNTEWESEGFDRESMDLAGRQNELISRVAAANPNTVVVLNVGSPVSMPWIDEVASVTQAWYLGQEQGNAIADVLFGKVNPSAKLPTTFPKRVQDNPAYINFPGENGKVRYGEGIFVGYRYYDKKQIEPLFPFGHGLSYTSFAYDALQIVEDGDDWLVSAEISNTGTVAGREIVQLYVHDAECSVPRPEKELAAFAKVSLEAGETKTVRMSLKRSELAFYDVTQRDWMVEAGEFTVLVGASAADIRLQSSLTVETSDAGSLGIHLPIGTLLDNPKSFALLVEMMPELINNPMLDMAKGMTLTQVAQFSEGRLTSEILAQVDEALKAL
ncbi:MAG: beta-glucosidase H, partial [Candidatus Promineifilaceae bacterium]